MQTLYTVDNPVKGEGLYTRGEGVHNTDVKDSSIGPDWHLPQLSRRKGGGDIMLCTVMEASKFLLYQLLKCELLSTLAAGDTAIILDMI